MISMPEQPEAVVLYVENSKNYQAVNTLFQILSKLRTFVESIEM